MRNPGRGRVSFRVADKPEVNDEKRLIVPNLVHFCLTDKKHKQRRGGRCRDPDQYKPLLFVAKQQRLGDRL